MSDPNNKTSKVLLLVTVLMCIGTSSLITQSSSTSSPLASAAEIEIVSNEDHEEISETEVTPVETEAPSETETPAETEAPSETEAPAATETPAPTAAPTETPAPEAKADNDQNYTVSEDAANGSWTCADGVWYFLVNGEGHRGWLNDSDRHIYYFDPENGSMQTGWKDIDGKRYYFNLDGVLQTGDITVDGQSYHLNSDGSLNQ